MAEVRVTLETVREMVEAGLGVGVAETTFGKAITRKALFQGQDIYTVLFPEMEEKWAVINGDILVAKYIRLEDEAVKVNHEPSQGGAVVAPAKRGKRTPGKLIPKEKKKMEAQTPYTESVTAPAVKEKPPVKSKAPATPLPPPVKEKPPTRRAWQGKKGEKKPPASKVVKKNAGTVKAVKVTLPQRKKAAPVAKIGHKDPIWRRQLNAQGLPEKVDMLLYPVKILCAYPGCGQSRWVDKRNAAEANPHRVTLCKPHQAEKKRKEHNAMMRKKNATRRAAVLAAAKAACKAVKGK